MKRAVLLQFVLVLTVAIFAGRGLAEPKERDPRNRWTPYEVNPHREEYLAARQEVTKTHNEVQEHLNSFDFESLVAAYDRYVKALVRYRAIKPEYQRFEDEWPFKLALRVVGVDLAQVRRGAGIDLDKLNDSDDGASSVGNLAETPLEATVSFGRSPKSFVGNNDDVRTFATNDEGFLFLKHFKNGMKLCMRVHADGYMPQDTFITFDKNLKKKIRIEKISVSMTGIVSGLTSPGASGESSTIPLIGAKLTFKHLETGRIWSASSMSGDAFLKKLSSELNLALNHDFEFGDGAYYVRRMLAGEYEITISCKGYNSHSETPPIAFTNEITLRADIMPHVQDFVLVPEIENPLGDETASSNGDGDQNDEDPGSSENFDDPFKN